MCGFRGNLINEKKLDLLNLYGKIINNMFNKIVFFFLIWKNFWISVCVYLIIDSNKIYMLIIGIYVGLL